MSRLSLGVLPLVFMVNAGESVGMTIIRSV